MGEPPGRAGRPGGGHEGIRGHVEVERKYDVGSGFVLPDLAGLPGVAAVTALRAQRLVAVYFDTEDRRLLSSRITLRRRTGGTDAGWHLKLPAGQGSRREMHAPLGDGSEPVPAGLAELVATRAPVESLVPVARLETMRSLRLLTGRDGRVLAEVADDRVTGSLPATGGQDEAAAPAGTGASRVTGTDRAGGPAGGAGPRQGAWRVAATWREVEVELADGPGQLLDAAGSRLQRAGATPAATASKLARLLTRAGSPQAEPDLRRRN